MHLDFFVPRFIESFQACVERDVFASENFKGFKQGNLLSSGVTRITLWPMQRPVLANGSLFRPSRT